MKKSRRQALGQHFLASPGVLRKIVEAISPDPDDTLVEIGAGQGILTAALAERAGRVIAIEKDPRLIPALTKSVPGNVEVIQADVLRLDFRGLPGVARARRLRAVGNLPYSISTPLLFKILDEGGLFAGCVFLLQKEVAERITAGPGTKKYAPLSILFQNRFAARILFTVPPGAFNPPPKVTSALLSLRRRDAPLLDVPDEPLFRAFLRTCFSQRRKMLRKNLERALPGDVLDEAFAQAGLADKVRAEELPAAAFVQIFRLVLPHFLFKAGGTTAA